MASVFSKKRRTSLWKGKSLNKLTNIQVTDKRGFLATLRVEQEHLVCQGCQATIPAGTHFLRKRIRKPWNPPRYGAYCLECEPWTEIVKPTEAEVLASLKALREEDNGREDHA